MSRKSRLMLTFVSAASLLLAMMIASTHSHFAVRGSDEISFESFCPCSFHESESGPVGNKGGNTCLVCKILAEVNSEAPLNFEFTLFASISSFDHPALVKISLEPLRLFRGRAPPAA